jgi:hypothetical protein
MKNLPNPKSSQSKHKPLIAVVANSGSRFPWPFPLACTASGNTRKRKRRTRSYGRLSCSDYLTKSGTATPTRATFALATARANRCCNRGRGRWRPGAWCMGKSLYARPAEQMTNASTNGTCVKTNKLTLTCACGPESVFRDKHEECGGAEAKHPCNPPLQKMTDTVSNDNAKTDSLKITCTDCPLSAVCETQERCGPDSKYSGPAVFNMACRFFATFFSQETDKASWLGVQCGFEEQAMLSISSIMAASSTGVSSTALTPFLRLSTTARTWHPLPALRNIGRETPHQTLSNTGWSNHPGVPSPALRGGRRSAQTNVCNHPHRNGGPPGIATGCGRSDRTKHQKPTSKSARSL